MNIKKKKKTRKNRITIPLENTYMCRDRKNYTNIKIIFFFQIIFCANRANKSIYAVDKRKEDRLFELFKENVEKGDSRKELTNENKTNARALLFCFSNNNNVDEMSFLFFCFHLRLVLCDGKNLCQTVDTKRIVICEENVNKSNKRYEKKNEMLCEKRIVRTYIGM